MRSEEEIRTEALRTLELDSTPVVKYALMMRMALWWVLEQEGSPATRGTPYELLRGVQEGKYKI